MPRGKFIAFEGGEGCGKDANIDYLQKHVYAGRDDIVFTREPGGTAPGEDIRNKVIFVHSSRGLCVKSELLLFVAARAQLVEQIIQPALKEGRHVISNRFRRSTFAYQLYGRGRMDYLDFYRDVGKFAVGDCNPDAYILLDVTPEVGLARVARRKGEVTPFDQEELVFHYKVRDGYRLPPDEGGEDVRINADLPLQEVQAQVVHHVRRIIGS